MWISSCHSPVISHSCFATRGFIKTIHSIFIHQRGNYQAPRQLWTGFTQLRAEAALATIIISYIHEPLMTYIDGMKCLRLTYYLSHMEISLAWQIALLISLLIVLARNLIYLFDTWMIQQHTASIGAGSSRGEEPPQNFKGDLLYQFLGLCSSNTHFPVLKAL